MKMLRTLVLGIACTAPALALAQWQWIDNAGRRVFSDQPPPLEVPQRNILKQPGPRGPVVFESSPAPAAAVARPGSAASVPTGTDKELEAKRKQLETTEAAKRKADEENIAKLRAENCTRAQQAKRTIDSGMRIARMNAKGEPEVLDDAGRAGELKRIQEIIASDCGSP